MKVNHVRRCIQLGVFTLVMAPLLGISGIRGNLNSADWWGVTLTDPLAFLEVSVAAGKAATAMLGPAVLVLAVYLVFGKAYCGWVCPVGFLIEMTGKVKRLFSRQPGARAKITGQYYWSLPAVLIIALFTHLPLFQILSPAGILMRTLLFGIGWEVLLIVSILIAELTAYSGLWCRVLCPLGAFYSLLGRLSPVQVKVDRNKCDGCQICTRHCHAAVNSIRNVVRDGQAEHVGGASCTRCGKCVDKCPRGALHFAVNWNMDDKLREGSTRHIVGPGAVDVFRRRVLRAGTGLLSAGILVPAIRTTIKMSPDFIRPPGAAAELEFLARCIRCGKCAQSCRYHSILMAGAEGGAAMGTPYVLPRQVPCYLCLECTKVCPSGAIKPLDEIREVKMGVAEIDTSRCLAYQGDICRSCYSNCPLIDEAIYLDDPLKPVVNREKCTGCGLCEYACVMNKPAITVVPKDYMS